MLENRVLLLAIIIFEGIALNAQNPSRKLELSFGATYTQLKHLGTSQDNQTSNGYYSSKYGEVVDNPDFSFGLNYSLRNTRKIIIQTGMFISGASAYSGKNIEYHGVGGGYANWETEVLHYHFYFMEVPAHFGFKVSKKYPLQFAAGVTLAVPLINASRWSYTYTYNQSVQDTAGNWFMFYRSESHDDRLNSKAITFGFSCELKIPIFKLKTEWVNLTAGVSAYQTSVTTFTHTAAATTDIMRMTHNSFYARIGIPIDGFIPRAVERPTEQQQFE